MSVNVTEFQRWSDVLDHKARILYAQIAQAQRDVAEHGGDDQMLDALCEPYIELLKSMYAEDYPLARAIEESDLLVSLEGPAISRENPRVSIITNIFTRVRSEVANVAKAIAQISESQRRLPKEMDLGLSAFAKGSLILGFTLPSPSEIEESKDGQRSLWVKKTRFIGLPGKQYEQLGWSKSTSPRAILIDLQKLYPMRKYEIRHYRQFKTLRRRAGRA
jgi:hypothetical protein